MGGGFKALGGTLSGVIVYIRPEIPDSATSGFGAETSYDAKFIMTRGDASQLRSWLSETPAEIRQPIETKLQRDLATEIRARGVGLIVLGIFHFVFSKSLEPTWGAVMLVIGLLNLAIPSRAMFIVDGIALIAAGLWNALIGSIGGNVFWRIFGMGQVVWGLAEFGKFGRYAPVTAFIDKDRQDEWIQGIRRSMEEKSTEDLRQILRNDREEWSKEALKVVQEILAARGEVPIRSEGGDATDKSSGIAQ